jgi:hypothetical protein
MHSPVHATSETIKMREMSYIIKSNVNHVNFSDCELSFGEIMDVLRWAIVVGVHAEHFNFQLIQNPNVQLNLLNSSPISTQNGIATKTAASQKIYQTHANSPCWRTGSKWSFGCMDMPSMFSHQWSKRLTESTSLPDTPNISPTIKWLFATYHILLAGRQPPKTSDFNQCTHCTHHLQSDGRSLKCLTQSGKRSPRR